MFRAAIIVAILGQVITIACAAKIPIGQFKTRIYREPPIPEQKGTLAPVLEYIEQNVDNFDPTNDATYQMVC